MTLALALLWLLPLQVKVSEPTREIPPQFNARLEIFTRLRRLERAWMEQRDPERRAMAVKQLEKVAETCFAGASAEGARKLDLARWYLTPRSAGDGFENVGLLLSRRLCERSDGAASISAEAVYSSLFGSFILVGVQRGRGGVTDNGDEEEHWDPSIPVPLLLRDSEPGDVSIDVSLWPGDFMVPLGSVQLSIVEGRDERLAALRAELERIGDKGPQLEVKTTAMLLWLLDLLAQGSTRAHDYPGARLLAEAEQVVAVAAKGERWYGPERDGEFWLALPTGTEAMRTRVFVPKGLTKDKPAPLVLALHGGVFDEDTWFDGYGCGQSVQLARERGWLLAAPRCEGDETAAELGALVEALGLVYPVDKTRVMLVGHSRGGGTALRALAESPTSFRAVATIGAALDPARATELAPRPLFLAVGDHDFARTAVEALHTALVAVETHHTTLRLYPNTEHWLCPTDALPDVFAWFDSQSR